GFTPPIWAAGADGRPSGPVRISLTAALAFDRVQAGGVEVLGMTGPGIVDNPTPPISIPPGLTPTAVMLQAATASTAAPLPPPAGPRRRGAWPTPERRASPPPAGALGDQWQVAVQNACGSWLARRDLTVSVAAAVVDPLLPAVDLDLTVANGGRNDVLAQVQTA